MLRNYRSRAVASKKQALMADHNSSIPSLFGSPRFFKPDHHHPLIMSPTSILDNSPKSYAPFFNPFWSSDNNKNNNSPKTKPGSEIKCEAIGLALINSPVEEGHCSEINNTSNKKTVLFGAKLRIQIPHDPTESPPTESPRTETQFGSPKISTGCLSVSEMELSEDYTCIISHGPDPKTTHIFDNCIVESYLCLSSDNNNNNNNTKEEEKSFLSFCHTCKKNLEQTNDIYIYRGEKAFCSHECRYQEMLLDEVENC